MSDLDAQIAALKQQIEAKDREQNQLRIAHATLASSGDGSSPSANAILTQQKEEDERSIFVRNVDYCVQDDELASFFSDCGTIEKIKILLDAHTGHPKGNAYICFASKDAAEFAMQTKHNTTLKGRTIEVLKKRTNLPGMRMSYPPTMRGGLGAVVPNPFVGAPRGRGRGGPAAQNMVDPLTYMVYWMSAMASGGAGTGSSGMPIIGSSMPWSGRGRGRGRGGSHGMDY